MGAAIATSCKSEKPFDHIDRAGTTSSLRKVELEEVPQHHLLRQVLLLHACAWAKAQIVSLLAPTACIFVEVQDLHVGLLGGRLG